MPPSDALVLKYSLKLPPLATAAAFWCPATPTPPLGLVGEEYGMQGEREAVSTNQCDRRETCLPQENAHPVTLVGLSLGKIETLL